MTDAESRFNDPKAFREWLLDQPIEEVQFDGSSSLDCPINRWCMATLGCDYWESAFYGGGWHWDYYNLAQPLPVLTPSGALIVLDLTMNQDKECGGILIKRGPQIGGRSMGVT
jgi:hypothetical protein